MNIQIAKLLEIATTQAKLEFNADSSAVEIGMKVRENFAKLIVTECANYADMILHTDCPFPGDYITEAMGFGEVEGAAIFRNNVHKINYTSRSSIG